MKEDARTDEQKARSKRAHADSMIVMGAVTTACALAAGLIAITGGDMPDFMYGRWGKGAEDSPPAVRVPRKVLVDFAAWGDEPFERAKRENKLVLLYITAPWSRHARWMEENVYGDPDCARFAQERLVPVRVFGDEMPDMARYEKGIPTTALLLPDRRLVVAGTGMSCKLFHAFIEQVLAQGMPAAIAAAEAEGRRGVTLGGGRRGSYGPDWRNADPVAIRRVQRLEDPVWGGFYVSSADEEGLRPEHLRHLTVQAGAVESLENIDPAAVRRTLAFVDRFLLLPDGGYATALDSEVVLKDGRIMSGAAYFSLDDARRREIGLPKVDLRRLTYPNLVMAKAVLSSSQATPRQKEYAKAAAQLVWRRVAVDGRLGPAETRFGSRYFWIPQQEALVAAMEAAGWPDRAAKARTHLMHIGSGGVGVVRSKSPTLPKRRSE